MSRRSEGSLATSRSRGRRGPCRREVGLDSLRRGIMFRAVGGSRSGDDDADDGADTAGHGGRWARLDDRADTPNRRPHVRRLGAWWRARSRAGRSATGPWAGSWAWIPAASTRTTARWRGRRACAEAGIEAVAVVTPNDSHVHVSECFLRHGIHVICDKPLANSVAGRRGATRRGARIRLRVRPDPQLRRLSDGARGAGAGALGRAGRGAHRAGRVRERRPLAPGRGRGRREDRVAHRPRRRGAERGAVRPRGARPPPAALRDRMRGRAGVRVARHRGAGPDLARRRPGEPCD